jgi:hypothetical protein
MKKKASAAPTRQTMATATPIPALAPIDKPVSEDGLFEGASGGEVVDVTNEVAVASALPSATWKKLEIT